MSELRIIHAADIHLDSPLRGLERYEGAPVERLRGATRRAFENLVALCIEERAALLLIAGDLFDGDWQDYNTGLFFVHQMERLRRADVRVFIVRGNHDAASQLTKSLRHPANVTELSSAAAESVALPELGLTVHGRSFPTRAVTEDLSRSYPEPRGGGLHIGMLHTSVNGREGHEPYAPCALDALLARGYDYWALGHVHRREVLHELPWVVFPGNLQGRHIREPGAKGATLIAARDGRLVSVEHRPLDVLRWSEVETDIGDLDDSGRLLDRAAEDLAKACAAADGRALAARLVLVGAGPLHRELQADPERWTQELRAVGLRVGAGELWIEKVKIKTRSCHDLARLATRDDPIGGLLRSLRALEEDPSALEAFFEKSFVGLRKKLPVELRGEAGFELLDPAGQRALLAEVADFLIPQLLDEDEEAAS